MGWPWLTSSSLAGHGCSPGEGGTGRGKERGRGGHGWGAMEEVVGGELSPWLLCSVCSLTARVRKKTARRKEKRRERKEKKKGTKKEKGKNGKKIPNMEIFRKKNKR
jgi:hypothetical protein